MNNKIVDQNIKSLEQLITPQALIEALPLTKRATKTIINARREARKIICGQDDRLLVVAGPCSIHNRRAAIEYGQLIKKIAQELENELHIIMRVYFEKPRTCGGWKGLINDPHLNGSFDINYGLKAARRLLLELNNEGIPTGTEFLDTITPQFISDLISWGAIGARTTESQIHRELASGLSMPIGFKNGTDGNIDIAIAAIKTASFPHHFLGITNNAKAAIVSTTGNDCHIILRGGKNHTNYGGENIDKVAKGLKDKGLKPMIMVDCSHGNSKNGYQNQAKVIEQLSKKIEDDSNTICGVMLESHLTAGKQQFGVGEKPKYNQSITDPCLSFENTVPLLKKLSTAVTSRRKKQ